MQKMYSFTQKIQYRDIFQYSFHFDLVFKYSNLAKNFREKNNILVKTVPNE